MKAVGVMPDEKRVTVVNHPEPELTDKQQVKIRILEVGVCGTDREITSFEYGTVPDGGNYLVLGHESLGEIVEVGNEVSAFQKGDLAVLSVRRPCPQLCPECAAGQQDFCSSGDYRERGIKQEHGFMTEHVVETDDYVYRVPQRIRSFAVLTEPMTIAEKAFRQLKFIRKRFGAEYDEVKIALVLGAGPVGILGAMKCVLEGYKTFVYSNGKGDRERIGIIEALGCEFIPAEDIKPNALPERCGGTIDLIYQALGAGQVSFEVLQQLGRNGTYIFTGVPGLHENVQVDGAHVMRNAVLLNQVMVGVVNANADDFRNAISDLESIEQRFPGVAARLITNRFSLEQYAEPLDRPSGIKSIISVGA